MRRRQPQRAQLAVSARDGWHEPSCTPASLLPSSTAMPIRTSTVPLSRSPPRSPAAARSVAWHAACPSVAQGTGGAWVVDAVGVEPGCVVGVSNTHVQRGALEHAVGHSPAAARTRELDHRAERVTHRADGKDTEPVQPPVAECDRASRRAAAASRTRTRGCAPGSPRPPGRGVGVPTIGCACGGASRSAPSPRRAPSLSTHAHGVRGAGHEILASRRRERAAAVTVTRPLGATRASSSTRTHAHASVAVSASASCTRGRGRAASRGCRGIRLARSIVLTRTTPFSIDASCGARTGARAG